MTLKSESLQNAAEPSREVRLGVVMFGGVSLAVYINGVSNELFRAVRGRGVYRLLKALTDSHVVVDVLSGASAGGINSVLLAAALCNNREFSTTGELWRKHADIRELMPPLDTNREANSVLDGAYYEVQLDTAVRSLLSSEPRLQNEPERPSPISELDLFVTGTDIDGHKGSWLDALGHEVQLENHRVLFRLKHRHGRKTPLSADAFQDGTPGAGRAAVETNVGALTALAHITSCFPGAFSPVKVVIPTARDLKRSAKEVGTIDGRLSYWGVLQAHELPVGAAEERQAIFMDGGVLDNKPFSSTIEAIFLRLADRQVSRYMLYVDPDPANNVRQRPVHPDHADPARRLLPVVVAGASVLPRFESIDLDLAEVELHNQQVRRYEALLRTVTEAVMVEPRPKSDPNAAAAHAYRRARAAGLAMSVIAAVAPYRTRAPSSLPGDRPEVAGLGGLLDRAAKAPKLTQLYREFDVLFGFRRLLQLTYFVDDGARVSLDRGRRQVPFRLPGQSAVFLVDAELLTRINHQIEFYLVVRARLAQDLLEWVESSATQASLRFGEIAFWLAAESRARATLQSLPTPSCFHGRARGLAAGGVTSQELAVLRASAPSERAARAAAPPAEDFLALAEGYEQRLLAESPQLWHLYQRFEQVDEVTYPLELVSELTGRDQIRTVRISPLDSRRAFAGRFEAKLCGTQVFAFGAFFKESWRCNDILWGRLDGVSQLLDILLDPERLSQLEQLMMSENLRTVLGEELNLSEIFPHLPLVERERLQDWLLQLTRGDAAGAVREIRDQPQLRELWAKAAQLEVLVEELPRVLEAAAAESELTVERAELHSYAERIREARPLEAGCLVDAYFEPNRYTLAKQRLPQAMPRLELDAILRDGAQRLKEGILQSLPPADTFLHAAQRSVVGSILSGALWAAGRYWMRPKRPVSA